MPEIVRMEGFKELDRALGELPKATAGNVLRRVLKAAAQPIADAAEQKAPKDEGDLSLSIVVSTQLTGRQKREARREGKSYAEVYIGPAGGSGLGVLNYATFVEFGTVDTRPQPYMRPVWDSHKDQVLVKIGKDLGEEIDKAAARLARKRGR